MNTFHKRFLRLKLNQLRTMFVSALFCRVSSKRVLVEFNHQILASSMHERNMSSQERLRIHNPSSSSKHSKNITFSKRSDLLENMLRDGEVTTKDQFTIILYSLLRLSVRFVSQYKPQVVKAILQEHPKSLSRAIDMLFTFVSCTSNVDEITVEK